MLKEWKSGYYTSTLHLDIIVIANTEYKIFGQFKKKKMLQFFLERSINFISTLKNISKIKVKTGIINALPLVN